MHPIVLARAPAIALLRFRAALVLMLIASCPALAASPRVADMTWTEVRDAIHAGKTTILVPIGGTEQNGPHMVLGKHNVRATILAERIAVALGNALVAPVVAYVPEGSVDPPSGHMRFPGTISIPSSAFVATLEGAGRSFRAAGFRDVVFLGDHGGYQREQKIAADHLNREWARTNVRAHAIEEYYRVTETTFRQALEARGLRDDEIGVHAGLADTSLALAIDPELVRVDRLPASVGPAGTTGVQGDARRATAELGALGVEAIVKASVDAIRRAQRR